MEINRPALERFFTTQTNKTLNHIHKTQDIDIPQIEIQDYISDLFDLTPCDEKLIKQLMTLLAYAKLESVNSKNQTWEKICEILPAFLRTITPWEIYLSEFKDGDWLKLEISLANTIQTTCGCINPYTYFAIEKKYPDLIHKYTME